MTDSFVNINTIKNLNLCTKIPLPLFKLIVTNKLQAASGKSQKIHNQQLLIIFEHERVQLSKSQITLALETLQALFKVALSKQYPLKAFSNFFKQNTMLDQTYVTNLLEQFNNVQQSLNINQMAPKLKSLFKMNWNIFNCKSDIQGNTLNKMYVKLQLLFSNDEPVVMFMTLPQFKIFIEEVKLLGSNITK